jgi:hypothetical protein
MIYTRPEVRALRLAFRSLATGLSVLREPFKVYNVATPTHRTVVEATLGS